MHLCTILGMVVAEPGFFGPAESPAIYTVCISEKLQTPLGPGRWALSAAAWRLFASAGPWDLACSIVPLTQQGDWWPCLPLPQTGRKREGKPKAWEWTPPQHQTFSVTLELRAGEVCSETQSPPPPHGTNKLDSCISLKTASALQVCVCIYVLQIRHC